MTRSSKIPAPCHPVGQYYVPHPNVKFPRLKVDRISHLYLNDAPVWCAESQAYKYQFGRGKRKIVFLEEQICGVEEAEGLQKTTSKRKATSAKLREDKTASKRKKTSKELQEKYKKKKIVKEAEAKILTLTEEISKLKQEHADAMKKKSEHTP